MIKLMLRKDFLAEQFTDINVDQIKSACFNSLLLLKRGKKDRWKKLQNKQTFIFFKRKEMEKILKWSTNWWVVK